MGANLNKLMQSYGVYTPTVSAYSGVATPDALKAGATAGERGTYQGALADYAAQQAAFRGYETDYKNRIANTNLYTSPDTASTFLSTPNYSDIRGMRANLSDTTSADTTDYTNPNFSSMINDAYRSLGRVGIGTDTSNIDQPGYNYWLGQLQAGANGGIAPRDFKNQFKIATNDYIRQKPDDDYTKYIQGYLGILPATTMPVLPTTGGVTTSGTDVDQRAGEGPGANPGSAYDGGGMGLGPTGNEQVGLDANQAANNQNASASATAEIADQQNAQDAADAVASSGLMARGGPVSSPTSMEEALLRDRSRHEFSDPRFEEIYGKYFYADGGGVANPTDGEIARRRTFPGVTPMYTGAPRVLASPSDSSAAERGGSLGSSGDVPSSVGNPDDLMSLVYNPGNMPQVAGPVDPDIASRFGRAFPIRFMPTWGSRFLDSSAAERGGSLGSFGDVPSSVGNPDDLMSLVYPRIPGRGATVEVEPSPGTFIPGRGATLEPEPFLSTVSAPTLAPPPSVTRPNTSFSGDSSQTVDAIKRAREALDAYRKGLTEQSSSETDPDAAEKWFRLAAAFLAPTKTGKFGEAVGNAATSEVERRKAETLRKTAEKNKRDEMGLKGLALDYKITHDEALALREDEKERNRARLAIHLRSLDSPRGVEASDINILLTGDPNSRPYAGAYARLSTPRVMSDGSLVQPNMNWAEVPTFKLSSDSGGGANNYRDPKIVSAPKPIPQAVLKGITENISAITQIDQIREELTSNKGDGVGFFVGNLPGPIIDRLSPEGVRLRAMIADIGSMKIHDRSGAAVTASEFPRLRPFIPSPTDSPETIRKKLEQFRDQYLNELRDQRSVYGASSGYKPVDALDDILRKNESSSQTDNIIIQEAGDEFIDYGRDGKRIAK